MKALPNNNKPAINIYEYTPTPEFKLELNPNSNFAAIVFSDQDIYGYDIHYISYDPKTDDRKDILCAFKIRLK